MEERISKCLQDKEDIERALSTLTKATKDTKKLSNELRKQLTVLKKSFDNFHPLSALGLDVIVMNFC